MSRTTSRRPTRPAVGALADQTKERTGYMSIGVRDQPVAAGEVIMGKAGCARVA